MGNTLLRVDNIMFFVKDLKKSEIFYTKVLGMKKGWEDEQNKMIGLSFPDAKMDRETPDTEIVIHNDKTMPKVDYSFLVKSVEEFCSEFSRNGYKVKENPFDVRCGKFAVLEDLDGNRLPIVDLTKFGGNRDLIIRDTNE